MSGPDPLPSSPAPVPPPAPAPLPEPTVREPHPQLVRASCHLAIFLTSICIMVMELVASRLIASTVGDSLYTWTAVIGIVLLGISIGNGIGGRLADRFPADRLLPWLFLAASVTCLTVYPLHHLAARTGRPAWASWPFWIVVVVGGNFLWPAIALGTISPVAASIALTHSRRTGTTMGDVFSWGAAGSIVGTFLTGFFLIDRFGTQNIIWMTAAALAIMGSSAAAGHRVFRAFILCGWLQFVVWIGMFASARNIPVVEAGTGRPLPVPAAVSSRAAANTAFHQVGLALGLRRDVPGEYYDESNYSSIHVAERVLNGDNVKTLFLDRLAHSYWNPSQPHKLYYDYENVYAALTERAVAETRRDVSVPLAQLPEGIAGRLPEWVRYDAAAGQLSVSQGMTARQREDLFDLSPAAPYWKAVRQLADPLDVSIFAGLSSTTLDRLPPGVAIPPELAPKIRYDSILSALIRYEPLTREEEERLLSLGPDAGYRAAVQQLFDRSRQVSTFFIGGGGYIFPRWIEAQFPFEPVIDVAELDPAVKLAVQRTFGLPPDDQTRIRTLIGDARNTVDDLLRENARRAAAGQPERRYDFVYGDAFNDFSVPWHLTTREFSTKARDLLAPGGMMLVNIIDIYPRAVFPAPGKNGRGEVRLEGRVPRAFLLALPVPGEWIRAAEPYDGLEFYADPKSLGYWLRYRRAMPPAFRDLLLKGARDSSRFNLTIPGKSGEEAAEAYLVAIQNLYDQTHEERLFLGTLPAPLRPRDPAAYDWAPALPPWEAFETRSQDAVPRPGFGDRPVRGYQLGYRGVMTATDRDQLLQMSPADATFRTAILALHEQSNAAPAGRFLGSYVQTVCQVFPYVYVFPSAPESPSATRDTFVVACSLRPLDLSDLKQTGYGAGEPFAAMETDSAGRQVFSGQMSALFRLARGLTLTDNFAPVDNLLAPVFTSQ